MIRQRFPVGDLVTGNVSGQQPFGVFIDLGDDAVALMETPSLPWQPGATQIAQPSLGTTLSGVVVDHRDTSKQIRLVAEDPWRDHMH